MKKQLTLLLAALLASSVVFSAAGCSGTETSGETTAADSSAPVSDESITESQTQRVNSVPDGLDFEGEAFRTAYLDWQGYPRYFFADEQNGDAMNDAIYSRRTMIEEAVGVTFTQRAFAEVGEDLVGAIKQVVMAGEDAYDMCLLHCISGVSELSSGGYLYNWDTLPYVDFTQDWWNREQMDVLRLGQNTYYGISDFMIPCPYVIYFNKELIENNGMENPYQLVYNGDWTLDRFCEMAEAVVSDLDGDGAMTSADMYGVSTNEISKYIPFMTAAGQFITQKNSEGRVELALNTEKTVSIVERFASLKTSNVCYIPPTMTVEDEMTLDTGRLLFHLRDMSHAVEMRDYEVDLGFLPYPKYDEAQENYLSQDWGGMCGIPLSIGNPEKVGAVSELLAFFSAETVIPAYYDVLLTGKLARDEDSITMIDLIFDTICYEVGGNYFGFSSGFSDLFYTIGRLSIQNGSSDFSSWYAKNENQANAAIESFYKALDDTEAVG